jgi:hypothetical protein
MNTALKFCKKLVLRQDNPLFDGWAAEDVIRFNNAPLRIRHAPMPPNSVEAGFAGSSKKVPLQD